MGVGLRASGKPRELPPDPKAVRASHFYPDRVQSDFGAPRSATSRHPPRSGPRPPSANSSNANANRNQSGAIAANHGGNQRRSALDERREDTGRVAAQWDEKVQQLEAQQRREQVALEQELQQQAQPSPELDNAAVAGQVRQLRKRRAREKEQEKERDRGRER